MSANMIEGIQRECNRCRDLVKLYEEIGPAGAFGKAMIEADIAEGEAAIASGDVARMVSAIALLDGSWLSAITRQRTIE